MFRLSCLENIQESQTSHVHLSISSHPLIFNFQIKLHEFPYTCDLRGKSIWGLWDYDVVEVFIQYRHTFDEVSSPYFELQLSPHNQKFSLLIHEPRRVYCSPLDLDWTSKSKLDQQLWNAEFKLTDPRFQEIENLYFGAFAILGQDSRQHYSLTPKDRVIDYHRPQNFLKLSDYLPKS